MTPSGIEPATFRFVAQHLNHCATAVPSFFNICIVEIITKWQKEDITGIPLSKHQQLLTLLFANDQAIISNAEGNLEKPAYKLNKIITEHG